VETIIKRKKVFVVDTSVLVHDDKAIEHLGDNEVVLHGVVLEELDGLKNKSDEVGFVARSAIHRLEEYRLKGSLRDGVSTSANGFLRVDFTDDRDFEKLPVGFERTNDNRIILLAKKIIDESDGQTEVILISRDINLRVKANACGIKSGDYEYDKKGLYSGTKILEFQEECDADIFQIIHGEGFIGEDVVLKYLKEPVELVPNLCCFFKKPTGEQCLAIYKKSLSGFKLVSKFNKGQKKNGVVPRNHEQLFAYHLLTDPGIVIVTLVGKPGSGKTLISTLAGYNQIDEGPNSFQQLIVYRPNIELGPKLGYLPGTLKEKFDPWTQPILDQLDLILKDREKNNKSKEGFSKNQAINDDLEHFFLNNLVVISPISFLRGRSLHQKFIIVDEAQNLTKHQIKTIVTRVGEGAKIVLTGDLDQIDNQTVNRFLSSESNGLTHVIQRFKGQEVYGHITMKKSERSPLAQLAADIL